MGLRFKSVAISGLVNECAHVSAYTGTGCIVSQLGCSEGIILVEGLPRASEGTAERMEKAVRKQGRGELSGDGDCKREV